MLRTFNLLALISAVASFGPGLMQPIARRAAAARMCATSDGLETVDDSSYESAVIDESSKGVPVLVDFFTDWCGPCKLIEPLLKEVNAKGAVKVVKAKPDETETFRAWLAKQGKHVAGLPTCVLFENGTPIRTIAGAFSESRLSTFLGTAPAPQPIAIPVRAARFDSTYGDPHDSPFARWSN